jgi:hypothetical protein
MLVDILYPSGLSSGRALLNYDWITLAVVVVIVVVGALVRLAVPVSRDGEQDLAGMPAVGD